MNFNERVQKSLEDVTKKHEQNMERYEADIEFARAQLRAVSEIIDFPEKTNTLKNLQKFSGKAVTIIFSNGATKEGPFELKDGNIQIDGAYHPIIVQNDPLAITRIVDKETGKEIFKNDHTADSAAYQYGMLFGKKAAVEEAQWELDSNIHWKGVQEENFNKLVQSVLDMPNRYERGNKMIYPQRKERWEDYVISSSADRMSCGADVEGTLKIMDMLENGATAEEAVKAFNEMKVEEQALTAIVEFSKRGPEFYKELEKQNEYIRENPKNAELAQKIATENKKFEREISDGGKQ